MTFWSARSACLTNAGKLCVTIIMVTGMAVGFGWYIDKIRVYRFIAYIIDLRRASLKLTNNSTPHFIGLSRLKDFRLSLGFQLMFGSCSTVAKQTSFRYLLWQSRSCLLYVSKGIKYWHLMYVVVHSIPFASISMKFSERIYNIFTSFSWLIYTFMIFFSFNRIENFSEIIS